MKQKDDDIRLSGESNADSCNQTPMPASPTGSSNDHETRRKRRRHREKRSSDIAIIGMSGRFAGSPNLEAFWSHLQAGESCIKEIQRKGWEASTHTDPDLEH